MVKNLVTIIIPTFNCEEYLSSAIESAISQTYFSTEIIVVDDGSTDNTKMKISNYINSPLKYIYQVNAGPAAARNAGIKVANGEYIAFLDSDDVWYPDFLEKALLLFTEKTGVVYGWCEFIDKNSNIMSNYIRKNRSYTGNVLKELFSEFFVITSSVVMKKECLDIIGNFNENLMVGEDYDLFLRIASKYEFICLDEIKIKRRILANSLSRQDSKVDAMNDISTLENFKKLHHDFYRTNKKYVDTRLSDYYFNLAYNCLERGEHYLPIKCLVLSIRYRMNSKAVFNIFMSMIPFKFRKIMKAL